MFKIIIINKHFLKRVVVLYYLHKVMTSDYCVKIDDINSLDDMILKITPLELVHHFLRTHLMAI